jgi:hypothetical protein
MAKKDSAKFKNSILDWESSYHGGSYNIIYDYPEIKMDWDIKITTSSVKGLTYYTTQKLVKMFLYVVNKDLGFRKLLLHNAKINKKTTYFKSLRSSENVEVTISPRVIKDMMERIKSSTLELKNLFVEHRDMIETSNIVINLSVDQDKADKDKDGKPDANSKDDSKTELSKNQKEEALNKALDLLGEIDKRVPYSYSLGDNNHKDLKRAIELVSVSPKSRATRYTPDQEQEALRLAKKLDISFDPEKDVVKSLRSGKLDISKLCEFMGGNSNIFMRVEEHQKTKPFSVVILCDESGSMGHLIQYQHYAVKVLYKALSEILPQTEIAVYGHTGSNTPKIYIYQDKYNLSFDYTIDTMLNRDLSQNYDGPVIEYLYDKIRSETDRDILMIVLSDGQPSGHNYGGSGAIKEMKKISERAKRDGFVIMGLGMGGYSSKNIYFYSADAPRGDMLVESASRLLNTVVQTEFKN